MTRARQLADLLDANGDVKSANLDNVPAVDLTNLNASNLTSGSIPDARVPASAVSQHATSFDDNKIVNDISTLAIRQASNENKGAYNTNSMYVDVFQDSTGITGLTNAQRNINEFIGTETTSFGSDAYETGDQRSTYTVTHSNIGAIEGSISNALDENNASGTSTSWYFNSNNHPLSSTSYISFDLGSGNSKYFTGIKIGISSQVNCGVWKAQGSDDGSNFTDLGSNFTWGSNSNLLHTWSNDVAYRYLFLRGVSGSPSGSPWQEIIQFRTKTGSTTYNASGSFESNAITAPSSTNKMGAIITYQNNQGVNALNSDIVLKLSADGGSNYSTATLTAMPDFASGIKMAKVNDLSVTAGTSLKYKLEFANQSQGSKEARIRGVSLQY